MAHLLLIDDEPSVRDVLARILELGGHEVTPAASGRDGLKAFEEGGADLVLTDLNMPEVDGIEVITALARRHPGVPIIAISGGGIFPKQMLLASARALGAVGIISKPVKAADLIAAVDQALAAVAS